MTDPDLLLDEIMSQIRAQEVPVFPRESMTTRVDDLLNRQINGNSVFRRFSRMRLWQLVTGGALAIGIIVCAVWLISMVGGKKALAFADVKEAVGAAQTVSYRDGTLVKPAAGAHRADLWSGSLKKGG